MLLQWNTILKITRQQLLKDLADTIQFGLKDEVKVRIVKRRKDGTVYESCEVPISYYLLYNDKPRIAVEWTDIEKAGFKPR